MAILVSYSTIAVVIQLALTFYSIATTIYDKKKHVSNDNVFVKVVGYLVVTYVSYQLLTTASDNAVEAYIIVYGAMVALILITSVILGYEGITTKKLITKTAEMSIANRLTNNGDGKNAN